MKTEKAHKPERPATLGPSLLMLAVVIAILMLFVIGLGKDVHTPLTLVTGVLIIYGVFFMHIPYKDLQSAIIENISSALEAMIIILLIGCTVGTWVASGTVPAIIYYGLQIFSPNFFLPSILIICAIMSVITGSSWTTMGTVGIAFMGVGEGLGFNPALTAGCIVCGAYFGDKQSPMSDTTNYAAAVCKTGLYDHVRSMIWTTGPAFIVSGIIFTIMGLSHDGVSDSATVQEIMDGLNAACHITPALLIPLVLMVVLIVLKMPAIPTILSCAILGGIFGMIFQGFDLSQTTDYFMNGYVGNTGNELIDTLLTRGGMSSMYFNIALMFWSLAMAGLLQRTGIIAAIMVKLHRLTQKRSSLIITHLVSEYILSFIASDPYLTMVIPANAFGDRYDALGLHRSVMSRTCEDGGTIVCPMVPWGGNGVYSANMLGVPTIEYVPYYLMGFINPIFAIICAITGIGCRKADKPAEEKDGEKAEEKISQ